MGNRKAWANGVDMCPRSLQEYQDMYEMSRTAEIALCFFFLPDQKSPQGDAVGWMGS